MLGTNYKCANSDGARNILAMKYHMIDIPRRYDARIGIGSLNGPRSMPWRVWRTKNDVYVAASKSGGVEKLSFHDYRICRKAFTSERGAPAGLIDRATTKWLRLPTPEIGADAGSCVVQLIVPTNYLSTALQLPNKEVAWIDAAPAGMAVILEMFFTVEAEATIRAEGSKAGKTVQVFTQLPRGEAFAITSGYADFSGENFIFPSSDHQTKDYIVSDKDPDNTGRPARISLYSKPKDGDRMIIWDYGAYTAQPSADLSAGFKVFNRSQVFDRGIEGIK